MGDGAMGDGRWGDGLCAMGNECHCPLRIAHRSLIGIIGNIGNARWAMGDGQWATGNRPRAMGHGRCVMSDGTMSTDGRCGMRNGPGSSWRPFDMRKAACHAISNGWDGCLRCAMVASRCVMAKFRCGMEKFRCAMGEFRCALEKNRCAMAACSPLRIAHRLSMLAILGNYVDGNNLLIVIKV
jgi:hypothetical protein